LIEMKSSEAGHVKEGGFDYVIRDVLSHVIMSIYTNNFCIFCNVYLCKPAAADRRARPLALLTLVKCIRAFEVSTKRVLLLHLINADL
jgi:hypothetical protein